MTGVSRKLGKLFQDHIVRAFCAVLLLTCIAYSPGLSGPFVFDDFSTFVENSALHLKVLTFDAIEHALTSSQTGPLGRPVALFTLAINYYGAGLEPFIFKLTNLMIHMLAGCLLLVVLHRLLRLATGQQQIQGVALCLASIWLLHPLNLTSVLYVVQRMTSLATLWMLLSLYAYLQARRLQIEQGKWAWPYLIGCLSAWLLGLLSKENALCLWVVFASLEVFILRFRAQSGRIRLALQVFWGLFGVLMVLAGSVLLAHWEWVSQGYETRSFSLMERLLTQARALWFYVRLIVLPDVGLMSLFHDDFVLSKGLFVPVSTFVALLAWVMVLVLLWYWRHKRPLFALGMSWFLIGHGLESSIFALELVHEHRNYFPMIGLLLALYALVQKVAEVPQLQRLMTPKWAWAFVLLMFTGTTLRASHWQDWPHLVASEVVRKADSARSQYAAARWYFAQVIAQAEQGVQGVNEAYYTKAKEHLTLAYQADDNNLSGLLGLIRLNDRVGLPSEVRWQTVLLERLPVVVMDNENRHHLFDFMQCQTSQHCRNDIGFINQMVQAVDLNQSFAGKYKAHFWHEVGVYTLTQGVIEPAVYYFAQAEQLVPEQSLYTINLAMALFAAARYEESHQVLHRLDAETLEPQLKLKYQGLLQSLSQNLQGRTQSRPN